MLEQGVILFFSFTYIGLLFGIAYSSDRFADMGRSVISNPYIYALSLAVYCTAWTFYGSVGRAAQAGPGFLPIYLGPTLTITLGWLILRKIIRISKTHRITSIADFIASRYGKSSLLGGIVTIIAVLGIVPYISLQLKAVSSSYSIIKQYPNIMMPKHITHIPILSDTAFYIALILAVFAILFGTRHLEITERHEGLVTAIAFESIVKLVAFIAVGIFVTYSIHDGFADLFQKAREVPEIKKLFTFENRLEAYSNWMVYLFLTMTPVMFLPRQFQVAVVENVNEDHVNKAIWLFPLYLFAINIFVLPVAFGGLLYFSGGGVDADTFVLTLPMAERKEALAILVYLGGMSAATGMVIVESIALSTMICNDLVTPILLRLPFLDLAKQNDLTSLLLKIRRGSILLVLLLGYAYYHFIGEHYTLVSLGLVSFVAVAQFGPVILGGIFWKGGSRAGALTGLISGFLVWAYTLFFPSLVQVGLLPERFMTHGPFDSEILRPFHLFGLEGFDYITHAVFWSMLANIGAYIGVSLFTTQSTIEHTQAAYFVDVFKYSENTEETFAWKKTAFLPDLKSLLTRFLGKPRVEEAFSSYAQKHKIDWERSIEADSGLINYAEKLLAGAIGSASARVMVDSVVKEEPLGIEELLDILDETRQVILYSRELEKKSAELEEATKELKAANERLKELDKLKDEFISTVTHELRTPLTSVKSLAEILHDHPDIDEHRHKQFAGIIIKESERLTRLISDVLDFQKIESGRLEWHISAVDIKEIIHDAVMTFNQLIEDHRIEMALDLEENTPLIEGDRDRLMQVMMNLISNAVKFCDTDAGKIVIRLKKKEEVIQIDIWDNGIGIRPENLEVIFEKFKQIKDAARGRPVGSGLGLTITKQIIEFHNGSIWAESEPDNGTTFSFTLPLHQKYDIDTLLDHEVI